MKNTLDYGYTFYRICFIYQIFINITILVAKKNPSNFIRFGNVFYHMA